MSFCLSWVTLSLSLFNPELSLELVFWPEHSLSQFSLTAVGSNVETDSVELPTQRSYIRLQLTTHAALTLTLFEDGGKSQQTIRNKKKSLSIWNSTSFFHVLVNWTFVHQNNNCPTTELSFCCSTPPLLCPHPPSFSSFLSPHRPPYPSFNVISHTPVRVEASREYSSHTRSSFVGRAHQSHRCCWATSWSSSVSGTADEKTTNDHWLPRLQHVKHLNIPQRSEGRSGQRLSSKKHRTLNQVFKLFSQFLVRTSGIRKHVWGVLWGTFFFFWSLRSWLFVTSCFSH